MTKTKAQIMKEYRQRKLSTDPSWRQKEAARKQKAYRPRCMMKTDELKEARRKCCAQVRLYRMKRKAQVEAEEQNQEEHLNSSPNVRKSRRLAGCQPDVVTPETNRKIIVKLFQRSSTSKKLAAAVKRNTTLRKRVWKLEKRIQRSQDVLHVDGSPCEEVLDTPMKNVYQTVRSDGISPKKVPNITQSLLVHEALSKEVMGAPRENVTKLIQGRHIKRYKLGRVLSKKIKVDRRIWMRKVRKMKRASKNEKSRMIREEIVTFMQQPDNAQQKPGKADHRTWHGKKHQLYILTDTLKNLHKKYLLENPERKTSLAFFAKSRPKYIKLVQFCNLNACLCAKHQNMALKIKSTKLTTLPRNPDEIAEIDSDTLKAILHEIPTQEIEFKEWRRTEVKSGIKRVRLVTDSYQKEEFIEKMLSEATDFRAHLNRIREQFRQIKILKKSMNTTTALVQMDFAENYACRQQESVQAVYYDKQQITIHPAIVHFKNSAGELMHRSFVVISPDRTHTAPSVLAFLQKLIPLMKESIPNLLLVHYLTDGPASQYRNRTIAHLLTQHESLFQVQATWQYLESGHGKGPCDGLGGSTKRMADIAVASGVQITNAEQYFQWALNSESTMKYIYVSEKDVALAEKQVKKWHPAPVQGISRIHSIVHWDHSLYMRETSCFQCCFVGANFRPNCPGWKRIMSESMDNNVNPAESADDSPMEVETYNVNSGEDAELNEEPMDQSSYPKGPYVACNYEDDWYVGQVKEVGDGELYVSFMEENKQKKTFTWPARKDEVWVMAENIISAIQEPKPTTRRGRWYTITEEEREKLAHSC